MRILISGAGIAGPALAYWLQHHGFEPVIVERAPRLRTGGYMIDFWGAGYDVAERMGLLPAVKAKGYQVEELREVDREGKRVACIDSRVVARLTQGRATSLQRGDLAESVYELLGGKVETIFGDSIRTLEDDGRRVRVEFEQGAPREFDLVIGADGLHSRVRQLIFGARPEFERYLGFKVAAFTSAGYRPRDELVYMTYTQTGQQAARFSMRDDRTMFLLTFTDASPELPADLEAQKAILRERFSGSGWECPQILERLADCEDLYFDRVSQIRLSHWSKGRVALIGDAAFCVSLLAGQGSALAMVAAYILAGELKRASGAYQEAFAQYEQRLARFIAGKQEAAVKFASFFAPPSRFALFVRNQGMKLMALPFVAELAMGRELRDSIELPNY